MNQPRRLFSLIWITLLWLPLASHLSPAWATDWTLEDITEPHWFERLGHRSIAIDSSGRPRVAYGGSGLFYAYWDGAAWQHSLVDPSPGVGAEASIVLGALDAPMIAYYDRANRNLKFAWFQFIPQPRWHTEVIDSAGAAGYYCALALGPGGEPHVAYSESGERKLKYAVKPAGSWNLEEVDTAPFNLTRPSISVDSTGNVAIAYFVGGSGGADFDGPVRLALKPSGGAWSLSDRAAQSLHRPSCTFDSNDQLHVIHHTSSVIQYDVGDTPILPSPGEGSSVSAATDTAGGASLAFVERETDEIIFGKRISGNWSITRTGHISDRVSQAPRAPGHLIFVDPETSQLKYDLATDAVPAQVIDTAVSQGASCSLALGPDDRPQALFWDDLNQQVRHAYHTGSTWAFRDFGTPGTVGRRTAFAVDSNGIPHILYREEPSGLLKYASWTPRLGIWIAESVAGAENISIHRESLALDGSDRPHVIYSDYDPTTIFWQLKYATRDSRGWREEIIDPEADSFDYAIEVSEAGVPRAAYRSEYAAGLPLRYASKFFDNWITSDLDTSPWVGEGLNLATDPSGNPHLLYITENTILRYKWFAGGIWHTRDLFTADSPLQLGSRLSLAIDSQGISHVAFTDGNLRYLSFRPSTGGLILVQTLDARGNTGVFPHIAIDRSDGTHIAYFSEALRALQYAYRPPSRIALKIIDVQRPTPTTARLRWEGVTHGIRVQRSRTMRSSSWQEVAGPLAGSTWTDLAAFGDRYFYRLIYP